MSDVLSLVNGGIASLWARVLVQFLWQGVACLALGRVALLLPCCQTAQRRYSVLCLTLAGMALCPVATLVAIAPQQGIYLFTRHAVRLDTPVSGAARLSSPLTSPIDPAGPPSRISHALPAHRPSGRAPWTLAAHLPLVVAGWLAGVLLLTLRLVIGGVVLAHIERKQMEPAGSAWDARFEALCHKLGLRRPVRLCQASTFQVPAAIGSFRPLVVMPAAALADLSPEQVEALLAHELAHIRRADAFGNLFQLTVETLLFFHPAVWWISQQIRIEREHCCDAMVVNVLPDRLTYARALTSLEEMRATRSPLALAGDGGSLMDRIRHIVGLPGERTQWTPRSVAWIMGLLLVALGLARGLRTAADPATPTSAIDLLKQTRDYYQGLHDFSMVIEHKDSSGLMPGRYTQTLRWRDDNRFELITTEYKDHPDHKADFYADGTRVTARFANGRVAEQELHGKENIAYGWEVSGGPIITWLQHTASSKIPFSDIVRWSYGPRKLWRGHRVRELCIALNAKPGAPVMNSHLSYFVDARKPILLGMETDAYHKADGSYEEYRNQKVNNRFSDRLGHMPIQLQGSGQGMK